MKSNKKRQEIKVYRYILKPSLETLGVANYRSRLLVNLVMKVSVQTSS